MYYVYIVMCNYLCVYIVMLDYLCLFLIKCVKLGVYIFTVYLNPALKKYLSS